MAVRAIRHWLPLILGYLAVVGLGVGWLLWSSSDRDEYWSSATILFQGEVGVAPAVADAPALFLQTGPATLTAGRGMLSESALSAIAPGAGSQLPDQPWRENSARVVMAPDQPWIAIVVDDMGLDPDFTSRIAKIPGPLTLGFLPYAAKLRPQATLCRAAGHELLVHLPMAAASPAANPGPNALEVSHGSNDVRRLLEWALSRFDGYVGVNNHMGSAFTASEPSMRRLLGEIRERGLLFLDSRTTKYTVAEQVAAELGVPFAERNIFIDNNRSADAIRSQLADLEETARRNGFAIGVAHARLPTLEVLEDWLPGLAERGFVLVPVSQIAERIMAEPLLIGFR